MTLDQARVKVHDRMCALIPAGDDDATIEPEAITVIFAGTDLYGPGVTRWLQERAADVGEAVNVTAPRSHPIAGELLRTFLVGFELGRSRA